MREIHVTLNLGKALAHYIKFDSVIVGGCACTITSEALGGMTLLNLEDPWGSRKLRFSEIAYLLILAWAIGPYCQC